MTNNVIVARHTGLVEWLRLRGVIGEVIPHVTDPSQIRGKVVYGVLPLNLAAEAAEVWVVDLPNLPAAKRGQELSIQEMDEFGATLSGYKVERL